MSITKEMARSIAITAASGYWGSHSYLTGDPNAFEPHEWVVEAILTAANGQGAHQTCTLDKDGACIVCGLRVVGDE